MNCRFLFLVIHLCAVFLYSQQFNYDPSVEEQRVFGKTRSFDNILYPGDTTVDIHYYKLNLYITWRPDYLTGEVTIRAEALRNSLSSFFLDLADILAVDSLKVAGHQSTFTRQNDKIFVNINPASSGELLNIIVYYQGIPGSNGSGSFTFGEHNGAPAIYNLSEPYGAKEWWPCKDTPADKADSSEVWLTVRDDLTAVSNGRLEEVTDNGDTKTYKWKNHYPIAQYLISAAISNYAEYRQDFLYPLNGLMPVIHYIYPENLETVKPELDKTVSMLQIFSNLFGPYPYLDEKYGHAQFGWGGGMEHQTVSSMGAFNENIISHELAHQWFGDKITCRDWHHIWLNEGFATYANGLYLEKAYGQEAYSNYIDIQMANSRNASGSIYVHDITSVSEIFNSARSYSKGAVVLHMLRGITGDSVFFDILKTYADHPSFRYNTAVTEDFQAIAESVYGNTLDYFFSEWIYGVNFPKYIAGWSYEKMEDNSYKIILNIDQQTNEFPFFFTMPLPVRVTTASGDTIVTVFNNSQHQQFEIATAAEPLDLVVDPDNFILKEILYLNTEPGPIPEDYSLGQNYPNPFNSTTTINFAVPITSSGWSSVKIKLYDVTGKEISVLYNNTLTAGEYSLKADLSAIREGLSSGIYIYSLESGDRVLSKKMILLK